MKICLICMGMGFAGSESVVSGRALGIALLGAQLRANGYETDILDLTLDKEYTDKAALCSKVMNENYAIVGFSIIGPNTWEKSKYVIRALRDIGYSGVIVLGGFYATFEHETIFAETRQHDVDIIIRGEGEKTMLLVANAIRDKTDFSQIRGITYQIDGKTIAMPNADCIEDLSALPFAAEDHVKKLIAIGQPINLQSSRGCYGNCKYCSNRSFYGSNGDSWRYRSAQNVVDEIEMLIKRYGARKFTYVDENFIGLGKTGQERAKQICTEILKRNLDIEFYMECRPNDITEEVASLLSQAGCKLVFLGCESGSTAVLKQLGRGGLTREINIQALSILKKYGIKFTVGFIMFTPYANMEDIKQNLSFLRFAHNQYVENYVRIPTYSVNPFTILLPYKHTKFYEEILQSKNYTTNNDRDYTYICQNAHVELLKRLLIDSRLHEFIHENEKPLTDCEEYYNSKCTHYLVDQFQIDQMNTILDYVSKIVDMVESNNLQLYYSETGNLKKELIKSRKKYLAKIKQAQKEVEQQYSVISVNQQLADEYMYTHIQLGSTNERHTSVKLRIIEHKDETQKPVLVFADNITNHVSNTILNAHKLAELYKVVIMEEQNYCQDFCSDFSQTWGMIIDKYKLIFRYISTNISQKPFDVIGVYSAGMAALVAAYDCHIPLNQFIGYQGIVDFPYLIESGDWKEYFKPVKPDICENGMSLEKLFELFPVLKSWDVCKILSSELFSSIVLLTEKDEVYDRCADHILQMVPEKNIQKIGINALEDVIETIMSSQYTGA